MSHIMRAFVALLATVFLISSCVGGRTEADPDKHPDKWERKAARKLVRGN